MSVRIAEAAGTRVLARALPATRALFGNKDGEHREATWQDFH